MLASCLVRLPFVKKPVVAAGHFRTEPRRSRLVTDYCNGGVLGGEKFIIPDANPFIKDDIVLILKALL